VVGSARRCGEAVGCERHEAAPERAGSPALLPRVLQGSVRPAVTEGPSIKPLTAGKGNPSLPSFRLMWPLLVLHILSFAASEAEPLYTR
jgi:hypothetical protein